LINALAANGESISSGTGILLSGFPPELNQVVKAVVVLCVLIVQSPRFITIIKGMRGHDKT
jgi:simple sugar transport system permease protein